MFTNDTGRCRRAVGFSHPFRREMSKAHRVCKDSRVALYVHVVIAQPLRTFARHELAPVKVGRDERAATKPQGGPASKLECWIDQARGRPV